MINVLIADEQILVREDLQQAIEQSAEALGDECTVAQTDDGLKTFRKAKRLRPDLIFLSASLPYSSGVQVVLAIRNYTPGSKLVVTTTSHDSVDPRVYIDAGVHGLLCKDQHPSELRRAICAVMRGAP